VADLIVARAFKEAQARAGVVDLEDIQDTRRTIVETHSELLAMHRNRALLDARRKEMLALCSLEIRNEYDEQGKRTTEKMIEDAAHTHPRYRKWIDESIAGAAKALVLENEIQNCDEMVNRGQAVMRQYSNEPR